MGKRFENLDTTSDPIDSEARETPTGFILQPEWIDVGSQNDLPTIEAMYGNNELMYQLISYESQEESE